MPLIVLITCICLYNFSVRGTRSQGSDPVSKQARDVALYKSNCTRESSNFRGTLCKISTANFISLGGQLVRRARVILKSKALFFFVILLFFIIPQPVSAYLDPGFGSMVWQLIVTVIFGVTFAIKIYWQKFKNFFSRSKNKPPRD
jgi:hypothetical protein